MSNYPEPEKTRSIVLFEQSVDMNVWFRDDRLAEVDFGIDDGRRWFQCGIYDVDPIDWPSLLAEHPGIAPTTLERAW